MVCFFLNIVGNSDNVSRLEFVGGQYYTIDDLEYNGEGGGGHVVPEPMSFFY